MLWLLLLIACDSDRSLIDRSSPLDPSECIAAATLGQVIDVGVGVEPLQIHTAAVFDGDGLRASWCGRGTGSGFALFTRTVGCDGTLGPVESLSEGEASQCDGSLATTGTHTIAAWQKASVLDSSAYSVVTRIHSSEGWSVPVELPQTHPGSASVHTAWLPDVARIGEQDFAVVGSWGHDQSSGFQVFGARISPLGEVKQLIELAPVSDRSQIFPSVASSEHGDVWVSWSDETTESPSRVLATRWPADGSEPDPPTPFVLGDALAGSVAPGDTVWVAAARDGDVVLVSDRGDEIIIDTGAEDFAPALVAGPPGITGLVWLENVQGLSNKLHFRTFDDAGDTLTETVLATEQVPPYTLHPEHVGDGVFVVSWPQGVNPDFTIQLALVR